MLLSSLKKRILIIFRFLYFRVEKEKGQLIIEIDNLQGINEALSKGKVSTVLSTLLSQLLSKWTALKKYFKTYAINVCLIDWFEKY